MSEPDALSFGTIFGSSLIPNIATMKGVRWCDPLGQHDASALATPAYVSGWFSFFSRAFATDLLSLPLAQRRR